MKLRLFHILLLLLLPFLKLNGAEKDSVRIWLDSARTAYDAEEPARALGFYKKVAEKKRSPSLFYNMGNAAFKAGKLGEAIYFYRKAEKRSPWDPDVQNNLDLALERTTDDFENASSKSMGQSIRELIVAAPLGDPWTLAFIFSLLCGGTLGGLAFVGKEWRSSLWGLFFLFLSLAGIFYATERWRISILEEKDRAVIMSPSVQVRAAPQSSASTAFVLHEGTTVEIRAEEGAWTEIRTPDAQVGWVRKEEARSF